MKKLQTFLDRIRTGSDSYGSIPFWSWNDRLEENELRRQIRRMKELGMNGFFMHARGGLETEYLSDEWFDRVRACVDEAKKLGMEAWSYDENGWPSGFAGGKLLTEERNFAKFLVIQEENAFSPDALCSFVRDGEGYRRVSGCEGDALYFNIYRRFDSSYVDTFDGEITRQFCELTHAEYAKNLSGDDFGTVMPGFFTDEPQYFRYATPWSDTFPGVWKNRFGGDVKDGLIALFRTFPGSEEFRYDYHLMMHEQFISNFVKVIYDWCEENHCRLTGHAVEEACLYGQMWSCGGVMPFYEYEHVPGIDYLGRGLASDLAPKQLGSVCAQLGKKKALSEMFACCGWDVSPTELKRIAELQYASGVNVMCQHLYAYSIRGQRKRDYPANYSEHLPWQDSMKEFNTFFNHLGYTLSRGEESVNTLVIHPIRSCYLTYNRAEDYGSIREIEDSLGRLVALLSGNQVAWHFADETLLRKYGSAEGKEIVLGLCRYDHVVIPKTETIDSSTARILEEYVRAGGKLWLYDAPPTRIDGRKADLSFLRSTISFDQLLADRETRAGKVGANLPALKQMIRRTEDGRIFYLVNLAGSGSDTFTYHIRGAESVVLVDMATLRTNAVPTVKNGDGIDVTLTLDASQSCVLFETEEKAPALPVCAPALKLRGPFSFVSRPENALLLDTAFLSKDGGATWGKRLPVMAIKDRLLRERYRGPVTLRFPFTLKEIPASLLAAFERLPYTSMTVNGCPMTPGKEWRLDRSFFTCDLLPFVKEGENDLTFTFDYFQRDEVYYVLYGGVSESLRNCLWFDTEIECAYLFGDFSVDLPKDALSFERDGLCAICRTADFPIGKPRDTVDPTNLVLDGYPFFAGKMELKTTVTCGEEGGRLVLPGRYSVVHAAVNGKDAGQILFGDSLDLSPFLHPGENDLILTLINSNRNLLGPHHCPDPEPWGVGPTTFSCESSFDEDGVSPHYVADRYSFVRFGIDL